MAVTENKRGLVDAIADAEAFREMFSVGHACWERWVIGGSIRRRKSEVSDVEHIVIPRIGDIEAGGLFNETRTANWLWQRTDILLAAGSISKHQYVSERGSSPRWGLKYRGCDFRGMNHEIFLADEDNWGSVLAIRTGPAERSKELVIGLQRNGLINHGGYVRDKHKWLCAACKVTSKAPYHPGPKQDIDHAVCPACNISGKIEPVIIPCPTEQEFFRMAGFSYVAPEAR